MRQLQLCAWARSAISAAALAFAVGGLAPGASAEGKYQSLIVFGDSYADLTLSDTPATNPQAPPGVAFSVWRVYPVPLANKLGNPMIFDFAVGGARALDTPPLPGIPPSWHLHRQVDEFLKTNTTLGPRDLVTLSIGGNDGIGFASAGGTVADAPAFGAFIASLAAAEIQRLKDAGAQTFVIAGFSGMSGLQIPPIINNSAAANKFGEAYFENLQKHLLPMAQAGTRFFLLDLHRLGQQVEANLAGYGLIGVKCPGGGIVCGGSIDPKVSPDQNRYFLGPDGLHLTNRGFEIVGHYMNNIIMAPHTIGVQPAIVSTTTGGFVHSLQGRLDATRDAAAVAGLGAAPAADGPMGLGATAKGAAGASGFTSFALGTFLGGSRSESPDLAGYDYESSSGTAGFEFRINRHLIFGVAGNYTTTSAYLRDGANIDLDAIQGSAYLSYATTQVFAEVLAAAGSHAIGLARPGVLPGDTIRSNTDADAFALAARAGYLFDFGSLRAGPIAGLTYIHARVDGYTEKGDDLLTYQVSAQTLDALTGNIGIRFLAPFKTAGGNFVVPHLNILLEHQLGDDTRTLTASLTQAPLLPIPTTFPNFESRTYARIDGGITFQLGPDASATISAGSTFARDEGEDYRVSAGLNYRF